ncbi:YdjC family protein [hydrothermal vent metagenome]|uniref:YdjC family protein n=1 Tax=hydrothermal vent metagenome TaxID=652676 RepID=A0A3B1CJP7_9ZZZZ
MISKINFVSLVSLSVMSISLLSCSSPNKSNKEPANWAEKLGFPEGRKVLMFHADDIGMCDEANIAAKNYLDNKEIQNAAIMVPAPSSLPAMEWAAEHPNVDVGLHLTLTSEWKTYRWGPVSDIKEVPGLVDPDKMFWHEVPQVVAHASPEEVDIEIRAQIEKAKSVGMNPSHIDTHMGTLYGSPAFVKVFLKVAEDYGIPANALDLSKPNVVEHFKKAGYPITDEVIATMANYSLPKLDFFTSVPKGNTYEEKREKLFQLVKSLPNGLTEIIFHPSVETENLKSITNSWQQRVWEAELFSDPVVKKFLEDEKIIFTNYKDIMKRFKSSKK